MKIEMTYDRIIGLVLLVFSIVLLLWIIPREVEQIGGEVGPGMDPAFMPRCIGVLLGFLSVLKMLIKPQRIENEIVVEEKIRLFPRRTIVTIVFFAAYMILTSVAGYLPASLVILPAYLWFFGTANWKILVPLSIGLPVMLYLFFARIMLVIFPAGFFVN